MERNCELLLGEDRVTVLRVSKHIVPVFLFKVVVCPVCQRVRFLTKFARPETDNHVES